MLRCGQIGKDIYAEKIVDYTDCLNFLGSIGTSVFQIGHYIFLSNSKLKTKGSFY